LFHGTIYRAANWVHVGDTRGYRRTRKILCSISS
jgi:hypothetical protein